MIPKAADFLSPRLCVICALVVLAFPVLIAAAALRPGSRMAALDEQHVGDLIGAIEGDAIAVTGPMSVEASHGQVKTMLRSGADVRVKSGTARIDLVEGGQITICGPAHLSLLKAGGALTVALDSGTIHTYVERDPAINIYTAQIKAQPVAIGDAPEDVTAGIDAAGAMCIHAGRGAVRIEHQLTGQNVIVPQGGDITLVNGQVDLLRPSSGRCVCELQFSKLAPSTAPEVSRVATAEEVRRDLRDSRPNLPTGRTENPTMTEEPIYQVIVPPLRYDAKAPVQPDIDPKMIILVRRVRVRPTLIFQGRVEGEIVAASILPTLPSREAPIAPSTTTQTPQPPAKKAASADESFVGRVKSFVRRLWSKNS
jgi:hypothetical protein